MIVYGSKEEYFESTWMKNEWTDFCIRLQTDKSKKKCASASCERLFAKRIATKTSRWQVLDAGKNTFYSDLTRYIDKVLASSEDTVELQRSKIKFDKRQSVSRGQARKIHSPRALQKWKT